MKNNIELSDTFNQFMIISILIFDSQHEEYID